MPKPTPITYHGVTASVRAWSNLVGLDYYTLLARIRRGWSPEKAIETPLRHEGRGPRTHGMTYSKEYVAWKSMIYRCEGRKNNRWHRYGGRGITVCERWRGSFQEFYEDVGPAPSKNHSLGRQNHADPYAPESCVRWESREQQLAAWKESRRRGNTS